MQGWFSPPTVCQTNTSLFLAVAVDAVNVESAAQNNSIRRSPARTYETHNLVCPLVEAECQCLLTSEPMASPRSYHNYLCPWPLPRETVPEHSWVSYQGIVVRKRSVFVIAPSAGKQWRAEDHRRVPLNSTDDSISDQLHFRQHTLLTYSSSRGYTYFGTLRIDKT